ncbi:MAG TPA: TIGR02757 family protein [Thermoanaerobaculia bacterium]|nr:TIGR02757 family protein [Thermoanaerobaculia bacterium]
MRKRPVRDQVLQERLNELVATFDVSTIEPDPLQLVLRYRDPLDQEVAALLAASFAYGRADIIVANIGRLLGRMTPSPSGYLARFDAAEAGERFAGFSHRFQKTPELVDLLTCIAGAIARHGSLGELFRHCYDDRDPDIGPSLTRFVESLWGNAAPAAPIRYLLTSPAGGSACKRMNLFLRWMVRRTPPDLGLWTFVDPARLVVPLDTHVHRIATFLGLSRRRTPDWKAARALTDRLARFDRDDPVRYDFAICRLGILDLCSRKRRKENCDVCHLREVCRFPVTG